VPRPFLDWLDRSGGKEACWPFIGSRISGGYGRLRVNGKKTLAHRVAWEQEHGPIPLGLSVLHHCDNPPCGNVLHLFLGTNSDNQLDAVAKKRNHNTRKTHCPQGHSYEGDNLYIAPSGRRRCRRCTLEAVYRYQGTAAATPEDE
jgi:hypothetical protein